MQSVTANLQEVTDLRMTKNSEVGHQDSQWKSQHFIILIDTDIDINIDKVTVVQNFELF